MVASHRGTVVLAAEDNSWSRICTPHYDVFHRHVPGGEPTEVTVFYFDSGRISGARIENLRQRGSSVPTSPRRRLDTVLDWLNAPGA